MDELVVQPLSKPVSKRKQGIPLGPDDPTPHIKLLDDLELVADVLRAVGWGPVAAGVTLDGTPVGWGHLVRLHYLNGDLSRACLAGACWAALGYDTVRRRCVESALLAEVLKDHSVPMDRRLPNIETWNDHPGRTLDDVLALIERAKATVEAQAREWGR